MNHGSLIIDFDSTLIQVEALDELAGIALNQQPEGAALVATIKMITTQGMNGEISLNSSLTQRLKLLRANKQHIEQLVDQLHHKITPSFKRNLAFLTKFAANIYIISSGFKEYITPIVNQLGLKSANIYANTFNFDEQDNITGFDLKNPLAQDHGKVKVVQDLDLGGPVWVIGDGITDYEIRSAGAASLFYAFTENITRHQVCAKADLVIKNFDEFLYLHDFQRAISYPRHRIKILLLENVHFHALNMLQDAGYSLETYKGSLSEDELCMKIKDVSILGIRSKTMVSRKVLDAAERLIAIGAFCIGTNQVALDYATQKGVCVFNAPYSNTRSVVEMVIGEIIMLLRQVIVKNKLLLAGKWDKSAEDCYEVRGKKLGIIGYGNIGSQLSVLAEALGMQVYYYDVMEKLQLGNARKCTTMDELLTEVDIVTLHVDGRKSNTHLIGKHEFNKMKDKVIFINLSRGHVVDLDALVMALKTGKILGAGIDVFPDEPINNYEEFTSPLRGFQNVLLSPHIGGSTEEAQLNIGEFVARQIINYVNTGDTTQSVNLPNIQLPELGNAHRLIHLHANVPGILAQINQVLAQHKANVLGQYLKTNEAIGYVISDIDVEYDKDLISELKKISHTLKSRVLY